MYIISQFNDSFKVPPNKLEHILVSIIDSINSKYQNKMIEGKGIGVTLYDIVSMTAPTIAIGTGDVYYEVVFNLVIFSPFQGELIEGRVLRSLPSGIQVTLNFTDSVFIDQCYFPANSDFDEDEQLWYWNYDGTKLPLYINSTIRFKVHHVIMKKQESVKPVVVPQVSLMSNNLKQQKDEKGEKLSDEKKGIKKEETKMDEQTQQDLSQEENEEEKLPLRIYGRINESGLGLTTWWS
ncbi:DNA-directed RNA polymerase III subunit RPC8, putative [Entamoeba dispar SAW760]|uniref:DNA-directed RNA polymerase III subunit RPC8, putative n=1 Tax=Entamoeba dispar (strain ATCC PRA-260 / SAW760) TaxID=370354 RepID=B0EGJ8_ENTDS|nr:DNA-directed RNA polymerase III subunit RPC8, putative [Entamoeba dispar SAW760]EDR26345.1 DNA-directed RNA polymerase III subunit RPC8, putative [Entamoeba dispar SAW760]|eukprot:EDR26345.1 DNA-directed RNA polymerase III subunit RPC8, putative [Entamoeba dispar SAW760]